MGASASTAQNPMCAVVREGGGLVFKQTIERPADPKGDEIIVDVAAAAINPVDYKAPKMILGKIAGLDFAGTISKIAEGASHGFKVGDEVYGTAMGSLANQLVAKASKIAKKPQSLSMQQAASMPTVYLTSLQGLRKFGKLQLGGRVLVIGASGGTGTSALQIAREMGASEIVAVCSGKNAQFVKEQGATKVIDYTKESLGDVYRDATDKDKFDVVYDCATNSGAGEDYKAVGVSLLCSGDSEGRQHGQYVAINGAAGMWLRHFTIGQKTNEHLFTTNANTADLDYLAGLADNEKLNAVIDTTFPFTAEGVQQAFEKLKGRRAVGKLVVEMQSSPCEGAVDH